jgi:hypothetical protein
MSTSFLATGYEHINRGGNARLFGVGKQSRYNPIRESLLGQLTFDSVMSSIDVTASSTNEANVILFANSLSGWFFPLGDFGGDFVSVGCAKGGPNQFANLTDHAFNDRTRSVLVANAWSRPEFRVSFRDQFLDTWNQTLDQEMGGDASRKGDPLMTWAAFPESVSYLDPNQIYLEISQALNINVPNWWDYDASITYHLFLYLDAGGRLRGYVQRYAAWVEGGWKTDEIWDQFWPKVGQGAAKVDQKLAQTFGALPAFAGFYYLPGRQLSPFSGVRTGTTWDDVTLVFQLRL